MSYGFIKCLPTSVFIGSLKKEMYRKTLKINEADDQGANSRNVKPAEAGSMIREC